MITNSSSSSSSSKKKMNSYKNYNKYFEDEDYLPCSQMPTQISQKKVLQSVDLNVHKEPCMTKKNEYRESVEYKSSSSEENSISNSLISQITQQDDNTQIKRMKFLESMMESTNHAPPKKEIELINESIDDLDLDELPVASYDHGFFGLSSKVKDLLKHLRGITELYEWQNEILQEMFEMDTIKNLVYLSPTSGGKTLVAEILLLQCLLLRKKNVIFVMPFVSIVQEKVDSLQPFGENLNFYVEEYAGVKGALPPTKRQKGKNTLYICTIEKAHSLINSLIESGRINDELGMVVGDELHMIGDGSRGAIYEMILAKAKYCGKKSNAIQIVATTATLENKQEIANFLDAKLYERYFRPVELKEYIKLDRQVFEIDKSKLVNYVEGDYSFVQLRREISNLSYTSEMKSSDPDGIISLINEIFDVSSEDAVRESCLIFCPSKKNCENVAQLLAKYLPQSIKKYKRDLKLKLFSELKEQNSNNICPVLRQSLQFGIAYHHSGLTTEERHLIEAAYREGVLFLLTCTSTLAAGVNLPAKRVIIRAPHVGRDFISSHQYRQMIGRAGRAGYNSCGESILLFQNIDKFKVYDLISGPMKRCESSIEFDSKSIRVLVLSLIGLNLAEHGYDILTFFKDTLFYHQKKDRIKEKLSQAGTQINDQEVPDEFIIFSHGINFLLNNNFVIIKSEVKRDDLTMKELYFSKYEISKLGMAAVKGGIDLDITQQLYNDLTHGLKTMVLSNYLHLLFLCTQYELVNSLSNIDYDTYSRKFGNLTEDEIQCANIIGISESFLNKKRFQSKIVNKQHNENVIKRFYMTLIIYELWKNNKSIWHVSSEFNLDRGFVQQIIQSSASFTNGVLHFCEHLDELWPYKNLMQDLMKRLQYNCSQDELLAIMELDNVRLPRAQQLFNSGYTNIELIAKAEPKEICEKIKLLPWNVAEKLIKSANRILKDKFELLQSEAENLLLQIKFD